MQGAFARKRDVDAEHWGHVSGTVRRVRGEDIEVTSGGIAFTARRALSCIVEPAVGDRVLVARSLDARESYVLAVLERDHDAPVTLVSPRDTELRVTGTLALVADDATIAAPRFSLLTGRARVHATRVTAILGTVESLLDRTVQRVKQVFRVVEEVDHVRAGRIDYEATATMSLHAENTTITAEGLVKMDGEQIQLG